MSTSSQRSLPRKYSDTSDKERPFVAVRRAHESAKPGDGMVSVFSSRMLVVGVLEKDVDYCL